MVCTGALPERLGERPLRADLRQPWAEHPKITPRRGRPIPYGEHRGLTRLTAPCSILPLMARIVLPPMGRPPVPAIGRPPPRQASQLTAGTRTVPVPAVAAAANGKRQLAPPTVAQMQNRDFASHRQPPALAHWTTAARPCEAPTVSLVPRLRLGGAAE